MEISFFFNLLPLTLSKVPELRAINTLHDLILFKWIEVANRETEWRDTSRI